MVARRFVSVPSGVYDVSIPFSGHYPAAGVAMATFPVPPGVAVASGVPVISDDALLFSGPDEFPPFFPQAATANIILTIKIPTINFFITSYLLMIHSGRNNPHALTIPQKCYAVVE